VEAASQAKEHNIREVFRGQATVESEYRLHPEAEVQIARFVNAR
jgi:hypothetical protein